MEPPVSRWKTIKPNKIQISIDFWKNLKATAPRTKTHAVSTLPAALNNRLHVGQQNIDRQWKESCCLNPRLMTVLYNRNCMGTLLRGCMVSGRSQACSHTCSLRYRAVLSSPGGIQAGGLTLLETSCGACKVQLSCRCHLAGDQHVCHARGALRPASVVMLCQHLAWLSAVRLPAADELIPAAGVAKGGWGKPACVHSCQHLSCMWLGLLYPAPVSSSLISGPVPQAILEELDLMQLSTSKAAGSVCLPGTLQFARVKRECCIRSWRVFASQRSNLFFLHASIECYWTGSPRDNCSSPGFASALLYYSS